MAKEDSTREDREEVMTEQSVAPMPEVAPAAPLAHRSRKPWIIAGIVGFVVLLLLFAALVAALHGAERFERRTPGMMGTSSYYGGRNGGMMRGPGLSEGGSSTVGGATRLRGVVTAIDGSTLTVAGEGVTTKVTTSDGTLYSGSAKPAKVNDTISVLGNKTADGSIAASQIVLSRQ